MKRERKNKKNYNIGSTFRRSAICRFSSIKSSRNLKFFIGSVLKIEFIFPTFF
jgi:hypothetical protein